METKDKAYIGVILAMLVGFTTVGILTREPTHYCEVKQIKAYCDSLSSTNVTCYTLPGKQGGKSCTGGVWKQIPVLVPEIVPNTVMTQPNKYLCNKDGCVKI